MDMLSIFDEARRYIRGWDSHDSIQLTAERGLAEEDWRRLVEHYGEDADLVRTTIERLCEEKVALDA